MNDSERIEQAYVEAYAYLNGCSPHAATPRART